MGSIRRQVAPFVLAIVGLVCATLGGCGGRPTGSGGLAVGNPMPPLEAEGWINGKAPKPDELEGKILVIDAWAYWCGPCRRIAPALKNLHRKYSDKGVVFIGLTNEGYETLPDTERFLKMAGIPWLNGYGANDTLDKLEVTGIPAIFVVGHDGKIVWNFDSPGDPNDGIDKALAAARKKN